MPNKHHTCSFSPLILSARCGCKFSAKDCVAEKEFGTCLNENAANNCQELYHQLRENSDFLLKSHHQLSLSMGQQSKIKMGGLLALQEIITHSSLNSIHNITNLVGAVKKEYDGFDHIPFSQLMPKIAKFKFRT